MQIFGKIMDLDLLLYHKSKLVTDILLLLCPEPIMDHPRGVYRLVN